MGWRWSRLYGGGCRLPGAGVTAVEEDAGDHGAGATEEKRLGPGGGGLLTAPAEGAVMSASGKLAPGHNLLLF